MKASMLEILHIQNPVDVLGMKLQLERSSVIVVTADRAGQTWSSANYLWSPHLEEMQSLLYIALETARSHLSQGYT